MKKVKEENNDEGKIEIRRTEIKKNIKEKKLTKSKE